MLFYHINIIMLLFIIIIIIKNYIVIMCDCKLKYTLKIRDNEMYYLVNIITENLLDFKYYCLVHRMKFSHYSFGNIMVILLH